MYVLLLAKIWRLLQLPACVTAKVMAASSNPKYEFSDFMDFSQNIANEALHFHENLLWNYAAAQFHSANDSQSKGLSPPLWSNTCAGAVGRPIRSVIHLDFGMFTRA